MDLTDTMSNDSDDGAVDATPVLPTLPPIPVLPPVSTAAVEAHFAAIATAPQHVRPNPAADAAYGTLPAKPKAAEPSPAALRAAEQRRLAKKRRRIRRIAMLVIGLAIGAAAGPPAARWISDNLDKAGDTGTESPAPDAD